ncbi:unnamed protein product [Acanthoscelides obtectus]|uniref:Cytochrome c oxidase subunit n=1 Tax=Acanthoscelides obtectus TaxID=200917 RepID=A0A9P0M1E1_ACAOB|nr:unnamed protein product [Acanthoscelides obtectus]CAK1671731.1 Cytochrome c oxidase subunit 6A1, mitochondrial [Acanthoscelides obtectus]
MIPSMNAIIAQLPRNGFHQTKRRSSSEKCVPPTSGIPGPSHEGRYKIFKHLALLIGFPAIFAAGAYAYNQKVKHEEERPPFVKYEYLRMRSKRFPWGDGQKSLFHNPKVNALPDGYEDEEN